MQHYKSILLVSGLLIVSLCAYGQEDSIKTNKSNAYYTLSAGLLVNESGGNNKYGVSMLGALGIKVYNGFRVGVGIGYEEDDVIKTLPVFFQLSGDISKSESSPYYYLNIGKSKVWVEDEFIGRTSDANF